MRAKYFDFSIAALWVLVLIFIMTFSKLGSAETLDSRFFYTGPEAVKFFNSLSNQDVFHYLLTEFFDLGFIVVYTALLFLSLKRVFYKVPKIRYFALIPGAFDFFETKTVIECLMNDARLGKECYWLGYLTLGKWLTLGFLLLLFLIKFVKLTYSRFKFRNA